MNAAPLLDFIAAHESEGAAKRLGISAYDVVWGGIAKADRPKKPLSSMTVGEVLAWQDSIDKQYMSEAAGRYQIMEDTLRGLYSEAGLTLRSRFGKTEQNRLAVALLYRRGLARYLAGEFTAERFGNELAKEWASLPCVSGPKKGRSFYDGDGLNKALVDVEPFLAVLRAVREEPPAAPPVAQIGFWGRILAMLSGFLGRK